MGLSTTEKPNGVKQTEQNQCSKSHDFSSKQDFRVIYGNVVLISSASCLGYNILFDPGVIQYR